ncbi:NAD(P) transhydrogenase subunit alpha [Natranaerofaba carboxydovora]|uniref:NAD(P) transhydrogenase subunit alpha n=1 Tax=Natranaerofaba carboxydovora TaxID=2742683 RepID=UPI001F140CEF|nr:NAD(P) transhydrogenase subunit alpha [Natranaerofaba carboxydovora]UMZ73653.1 NAD(P) transhydrogenase subunit alpha [Natranaerofaba carboxydovora]
MFALLILILAVASILGYLTISKVPPLLHTPLMSGMNALSGVTLIGAVAIYATAPPEYLSLAGLALILAMINVVGGFYVTERMLKMFNKKDPQTIDKEQIPWQ